MHRVLAEALPAAAGDLARAGPLLTAALEAELVPVEAVAVALVAERGVPYRGVDASVCPFLGAPSLADSFESLGLGAFGESGTLAACALVTGALKAIRAVKIVGYTGLMLPPLEDKGLAARADAGGYSVHDLLMYSAVCGLGLDNVPVPGDVPEAKLAALFLDVAALAFRLDKPLSARVMPAPGLKVGDTTTFQNKFMTNARVFAVP